jgi:Xaa-Pro aminopeptidase
MPNWLAKNLPPKSRIGVDPMLMSTTGWNDIKKKVVPGGHSLVQVRTNLVDLVWPDKPAPPSEEIHLHPLEFTGT